MYQFLIQLISALVALRFTLPPFSSPRAALPSYRITNSPGTRGAGIVSRIENEPKTLRVPWPQTPGPFAGSPRHLKQMLAAGLHSPQNARRRTATLRDARGYPAFPRGPAPPSPYTGVD